MNSPCYIALDIGGTKTAVSLWEGETSLLQKIQFPTPASPQEALAKALDALDQARDAASIEASRLAALGISCGGPLDSARGLILSPPNLPGWDAIPVVSLLQEKTGLPCFLENDANACALAEWRWGAGRGCRDMAFLTFGTGLGCGLILNNSLHRGAGDLAGEVGISALRKTVPKATANGAPGRAIAAAAA
jgi:glucokinase